MAEVTVAMIQELRKCTGIGMAKCKQALEAAGGDVEKAIADLRKAGLAQAAKKSDREANEGKIGVFETDEAIAILEINAETDFVVNNADFQTFVQEMAQEAANTKPASLEAFLEQPFSKDSSLTIDGYRGHLVQKLGENIQIRRLEILPKESKKSIGVYSHLGGKLVTVVFIEGSNEVEPLSKDVAMHVAAANPDYLNPDAVPSEVIEKEREIAKVQMKGKPENIIDKILLGKVNAFYDQVCLTRQKFIKDDSVSVEDLVKNYSKEAGTPLAITSFSRWSLGQS